MALPLYDLLEKGRRNSGSSRTSLDDPARFSMNEEVRLNELDPLHSSSSYTSTFDYDEEPPARARQSRLGRLLSRKTPLGFHARKEAKDEKIQKLKRTFLVPGRLCIIAALIVASIGFAIVGGGGYWVYKQEPELGKSPAWYPTPKGGTVRSWEESYRKAALLVSNMTLLEKVNVTTGTGWMMGPCVGNTAPATSVGFPALCLQDGPLGIRFADHITATPAGVTVGATWNKDLMYKRGRLLGLENRLKGVNIMLGPAVGPLGRMPAGGRNWEGFGSDPVLQGWAAAQTIKGIQEEGVIATIKHFIGNEQEHFRQSFEWGLPNAISSNIDDRTLHEIYAWPFADSVRAGVGSVMCSYNQVNNSYACQNSKLLNGILKDELGFQGFVQSDWLAQRSGVASALAGLDMSMPGDGLSWADGDSVWGPHLTLAALNGSLPMERLDDMVTRIVAAWYQMGQDDQGKWPSEDPNFSSWTKERAGLIHPGSDDKTIAIVNQYVDVQRMGGYSHSSLVRRIAAEATILLKNDGDTLPLSREGYPESAQNTHPPGGKYRIAIFGEDATSAKGGPNVCTDRGCNQGTLASGWGSGAVEFPYLVSPLESLQHGFYADRVDIAAFPTNDLPSAMRNTGIEEKDLCIVFANADAGEGFIAWNSVRGDRNDLNLQKNGEALIKDVAANCGRTRGAGNGTTIVVIHSVGPVIMESFIEDPQVRAVIYANLPGQESGHALADVIFGDYVPSGRLPYTIGKSLEDYGPGAQVLYYPNGVVPQQNFTEGVLVDYRWFDAQNIEPRFPFGYGLSYTNFDLRDLVIAIPEGMTRPDPLPAPRPEPEVSPPQYDSKMPAISDLLFPSSWRKLKKYVYPYLESSEIVENGEYPYPDMTPQTPGAAGGGEGGNPSLWDVLVNVDVTVVNTGHRDGQSVVQLYVVFPEEVWEDVWEDSEHTSNGNTAADSTDVEDLQSRQLTNTEVDDLTSEGEPNDMFGDENLDSPTPEDHTAAEFGVDETAQHDVELPEEVPDDAVNDDIESEGDVMESGRPMEDAQAGQPTSASEGIHSEEPAQKESAFEEAQVASQPEQPTEEESSFEDFQIKPTMQEEAPRPESQPGESAEEDSTLEHFQHDAPSQEEPPQQNQPPTPPPSTQPDSAPEEHPFPDDTDPSSPPQPPTSPPQPQTAHRVIGRERIHFPPRVLRAFEKVNTYTTKNGDAQAADTKVVTFQLTRRDLSYWSVRRQNWVVPEGSFTVEVGFSSRDLRVRGSVF